MPLPSGLSDISPPPTHFISHVSLNSVGFEHLHKFCSCRTFTELVIKY